MHNFLEQHLTPTVGFLIKLLAGIAVAFFGVFGVGAKTRNDDDTFNRNGWIAIVGIAFAGFFAVGANVFDFTTTQKSAREDKAKNERLMLSVQSGLYPLRNISGQLTIGLKEPFPGVAEYKAMLRKQLHSVNGECKGEPNYVCYSDDLNENRMVYEIGSRSPLFPSTRSITGLALTAIKVQVLTIKSGPEQGVDPADPYFHHIGAMQIRLNNVDPGDIIIRFTPDINLLEYSIKSFSVPNEEARRLGAYSLVELLSGYVAASTTISDLSFCSEVKPQPTNCAAQFFEPIWSGMALNVLQLKFEYPKAILLERKEDIACSSKDEGDQIVAALPNSIDEISSAGVANPVKVSTVERKRLCTALSKELF